MIDWTQLCAICGEKLGEKTWLNDPGLCCDSCYTRGKAFNDRHRAAVAAAIEEAHKAQHH